MQTEMVKIYENEKFSLYTGSGSKNTGLLAFQPDDGTGHATNDTFSVSSVECRVSDFSGKSRMYAPWEDIGKRNTRPGTVSLIWDDHCTHWCACNDMRAIKPEYIMTGKVYTPKKGASDVLRVRVGDYITVVAGSIQYELDESIDKNFSVRLADVDQLIRINAIVDSVIFVITATPY
jgi:hypothetical protein